jgi:hypothetical protein
VFPYRIYEKGVTPDQSKGVVYEWTPEVVTLEGDCNGWYMPMGGPDVFFMEGDVANTAGSGGPAVLNLPGAGREAPGIGGSMARFTLLDAYLYAIDDQKLNVFNIDNPVDPIKTGEVIVGTQIETIWPNGYNLFIGSQNGMHIYSVVTPGQPQFVSTYAHVTNCDPVVVDGNYAFVTLRSGTPCMGFTNQLDVVDITDLHNPFLLETYPMFNPHGLGVDGNLLFICDGEEGLKIYDKNDLTAIEENIIVTYPTINAWDVIPYGTNAMMIGDDGLYQYDYSDVTNISLMSVIPIDRTSTNSAL